MLADDVKDKLKVIAAMEPKDINDLIPLMQIETERLQRILEIHQLDRPILIDLCQCNRIYYFSKRFNVGNSKHNIILERISCNYRCLSCIQMEPSRMAQVFANNPFMLDRCLQSLAHKLHLMTQFKVPLERILKDLRCLTSGESVIKARLQRVSDFGIPTPMPWMIRCTKAFFER